MGTVFANLNPVSAPLTGAGIVTNERRESAARCFLLVVSWIIIQIAPCKVGLGLRKCHRIPLIRLGNGPQDQKTSACRKCRACIDKGLRLAPCINYPRRCRLQSRRQLDTLATGARWLDA